jgi:4-methylaminobutanoate oxidase (formaldehyde-forming)
MGDEPVFLNGVAIGYVRAGAYGHTLGASVGLAMIEHADGVTAGFLKTNRFQILVNYQMVGAILSLGPLYDPGSERVRQ